MKDDMIKSCAEELAKKFMFNEEFDFNEFDSHYNSHCDKGFLTNQHCFAYCYAHACAEYAAQLICQDINKIDDIICSFGIKIAHLNECDFAYALDCLKIQLLSKTNCITHQPVKLKEEILQAIHSNISQVLSKENQIKQVILNHVVYQTTEETIQ